MPIHDWTKVDPGIFHDFQIGWNCQLSTALNSELLPKSYYALIERSGTRSDLSDGLAETHDGSDLPPLRADGLRLLSVDCNPPHVSLIAVNQFDHYFRKQNLIAIRREYDDRLVAQLIITAPGNKSASQPFTSIIESAVSAISHDVHLLIIDLFPPTARDPQGIHGAIWKQICDDTYQAPREKPLTLAAYSAGDIKKAYIEPIVVGEALADMPLFLEPSIYINVPLEATYQSAWSNLPIRWRRVLDPAAI